MADTGIMTPYTKQKDKANGSAVHREQDASEEKGTWEVQTNGALQLP